jgi:hypothetical protein
MNPQQIQELVLEVAQEKCADKQETEDKFYQLLGELKRDREEQARRWNEQNHRWKEYVVEQNRKWDEYAVEQNDRWNEQNHKWREYHAEQERKWDQYTAEQNRKWDETQKEFKQVHEKFEQVHEEIKDVLQRQHRTFAAMSARWGMESEKSFRNTLIGVLSKNFGVEVINIVDYDEEGIVYGHPEYVELDIIIKNGLLIVCELKSSISKGEVYIFEHKVRFYEKRYQRPATRLIMISPMIDPRVKTVAKKLGVELYTDSTGVKKL